MHNTDAFTFGLLYGVPTMCKWFTYQLKPTCTQESFIFEDYIILILKTFMLNCKLSKIIQTFD